ncbi:MAG TPA: type II toxin-antitoxin system VapC family toxin [Phycisphaerae bacterium]
MTGYVLDTNHLSAALDDESVVYKRILAARREGWRVGSCSPVLCELAAGIEQTARREENWKALRVFLRQIRIWPIDFGTVQIYGRVYSELRQDGRVLSQVDMMVAALARRMDLTVLTTDRDFGAISSIKTENWLAG